MGHLVLHLNQMELNIGETQLLKYRTFLQALAHYIPLHIKDIQYGEICGS